MKNPDFIIIGSGIAGLNFALSAAKLGKVLIITKKKTVHSSTNHAQGGIAAVLDKTDDFKTHVEDTLTAGAYHNDRKAVEFMVRKGPEAIRKLIEFGVNFAHHKGEIILTREGGHKKRRIAFVGDYTGKEIEAALIKNVKKHPNIEILEHTTAVDLLVKNGECFGVQIIRNKKIENLPTGAVIIATGGIGQLYKCTTNPKISTGDGLAIGRRAGLKTKDLEFIQFHPTALALKGAKAFLLSEALRGEGAYIVNGKGERFMKKTHAMAELAPRDIVARAIYEELKKSRVYLDMRHLDAEHTKVRFPHIYSTLLRYKLDLTKDLIPIAPAAHYICGGLKINRKGETCIKNVFAFGEVACTGVHGANRLASNSLLEALVYSNEISENLKKNHTKINNAKSFERPSYKQNSKSENKFITQLESKLKKTMWEHTGIVRTESGLQNGLWEISNLKKKLDKKFKPNVTNEKLLEIRNMLEAAKAITESAATRKQSLGAHYIMMRT